MTSDTGGLLDLERAGWEALSADGETARRFYDQVLAREVLMLLPGGLIIDGRQQAVEAMSGAPWDAFEMSDERVRRLTDGAEVVAYKATARRGEQRYEAWCNSTYVRENGAWRLALHQQTPLS
jgi:hypothetical protein